MKQPDLDREALARRGERPAPTFSTCSVRHYSVQHGSGRCLAKIERQNMFVGSARRQAKPFTYFYDTSFLFLFGTSVLSRDAKSGVLCPTICDIESFDIGAVG